MYISIDLPCIKYSASAFYQALKPISITLFFWIFLGPFLGLFLGLFSSQTAASVIFQDEFSRSNSNDPGLSWVSFESDENDIAIYNQQLRLRDQLSPGGTHASLFVDASDFENLSLSFSWRVLSSTETSDSLIISGDLDADAQNQILFSTGLGSAGTFSKSLALQDSYAGWLGFWLNVNSSSEAVYIDNVLISGNRRTSEGQESAFEVSEASSFVLLCMGLVGLAGARRSCSRSLSRKRCASSTRNIGV